MGRTGAPGVLVGFENKATVYQIIQLRDNNLIRTCHTVFDEGVFPEVSNKIGLSSDIKVEDYFVEEIAPPCIVPVASLPSSPAIPCSDVQNGQEPVITQAKEMKLMLINSNISESDILPYQQQAPHAFVTSTVNVIPSHYNQAIRSPESASLLAAIKTELDAMEHLNVWSIVDRQKSMRNVGTTWVF
jgi:hypothetical protein